MTDQNGSRSDSESQPQDVKGNLTSHRALTAQPNRSGGNNTLNRITRIAEVVIAAIVGAALIGVGLLQYGIYSQQAEIMRIDQRAWLYPEKFEFAGDILFRGGNEVTTFVDVTLKNSGRSPAAAYRTALTLQSIDDREYLFTERRRIDYCKDYPGKTRELAATVFPGQTVIEHHKISTIGAFVDIPPEIPKDKPVHLAISGCVLYHSGADWTVRCTGIWVVLLHSSRDPFEFRADVKNYPKDSLKLFHDVGGQFVDDCGYYK